MNCPEGNEWTTKIKERHVNVINVRSKIEGCLFLATSFGVHFLHVIVICICMHIFAYLSIRAQSVCLFVVFAIMQAHIHACKYLLAGVCIYLNTYAFQTNGNQYSHTSRCTNMGATFSHQVSGHCLAHEPSQTVPVVNHFPRVTSS